MTILNERHVTVFECTRDRSWPKYDESNYFAVYPLPVSLTESYDTDAHFSPYSSKERRGRFAKYGADGGPGAHELLKDGVFVMAYVADVDCDEVHGTRNAAPLEWRAAEQEKLEELQKRHPGVFAYDTRGGYRLVMYLPEPFQVASRAHDDEWKVYYNRIQCYFHREFGITSDPACSDWTRQYRLPDVVRDGERQQWATYGDCSQIGILDHIPRQFALDDDIDTAKWLSENVSGKWNSVHRRLASARNTIGNEKLSSKGARAVPSVDNNAQPDDVCIEKQSSKESRAVPSVDNEIPLHIRVEAAESYVKACKPAVDRQGGHNQLFSVARHAGRGFALSREALFKLLKENYNSRCEPPWTDEELWHKVDDGLAANSPEFGSKLKGVKCFSHMSDIVLAEGLLGEMIVYKNSDSHIHPVSAEGSLYRYSQDSGLYVPVPSDEVTRRLKTFDGAKVGKGKDGKITRLSLGASRIRGVGQIASDLAHRPDFFANAPDGIAFSNGFLTLDRGKLSLSPHSPDNRARDSYPFPYKKQHSQRFDGFLSDLVRGDSDAMEKIALQQEFFGISLFGLATLFQTLLVLLGKAANGKSTLLQIIEAAMPVGSTSSVAPQEFSREYSRAELVGKRLNVMADIPENDIMSSSFKNIITGDSTSARRVCQRVFFFRPIAGHVFSANKLPGTKDHSEGFFRRFVIIEFNNQFKPGMPGFNPNIAKKIIADDLPAVVSWMVEGAARAQEMGRLKIPSSSRKAGARWRKDADSVALYAESELRTLVANETGVSADGLFKHYSVWASANGYKRLAKGKFKVRLSACGFTQKATSACNLWDAVPIHPLYFPGASKP